jgi:Co/Zn/Cd efflux system component
LCRDAASELLDINPDGAVEDEVQTILEAIDDVRVSDLHVWSMGRGRRSCIATVVTDAPRDVDHYRAKLAPLGFVHLTIEVRRCPSAGEPSAATA